MHHNHIYPLRVHVEDTDFGGVVFHANYLKFFERARSEWAEEEGRGIAWHQQQGIFFLVRKATLEFLKPAKLHQQLEVVTYIKERRRASLIYVQYLRLAGITDTILCKAEIKVACVDSDMRPRPLP
jgi:acyl-CoA thioester hydrolase